MGAMVAMGLHVSACGPSQITPESEGADADADEGQPECGLPSDEFQFACGQIEPTLICAELACDTPFDELSHAEVIQPFWDLYCAQGDCHGGAAPAEGLDLSIDAYDRLIGVPSMQSATAMPLITPGAPSESYLWQKLVGTQTCPAVGGQGERMPKAPDGGTLDPFNDAQMRHLTTWICAGAPQ